MERRDIEILLTLAEELHFGRTAERLHVSQARVSQAIKKLERQIGATLFARTSRRVELTPIGRQLCRDVRQGYRQIQDGVDTAMAASRGVAGRLPIGFEAPAVADLMADVLAALRDRHPDCEIQIRDTDFRDPLGLLRAGAVDVAVTNAPVIEPGLVAGPDVCREPVVLAVSADHPLASRTSLGLDDLAGQVVFRAGRRAPPYWKQPPTPWHAPNGREIHRGSEVATVQELFARVADGQGVSPLAAHATRYFARPTLRFVPFEGTPPVTWCLAWRAAGETNRIRALAHAARHVDAAAADA